MSAKDWSTASISLILETTSELISYGLLTNASSGTTGDLSLLCEELLRRELDILFLLLLNLTLDGDGVTLRLRSFP